MRTLDSLEIGRVGSFDARRTSNSSIACTVILIVKMPT